MLLGLTIPFLVDAGILSFKNFDQEIVLEKNESGFVDTMSQKQIIVAHRLIVKTSNKYSKKKLAKAHKAITEVKELYHGKDFTYFSAEINKEITLQEVMSKLLKKRKIHFVQPDILQQTQRSHDGDEHAKEPLPDLLKKPKNNSKNNLKNKSNKKINKEKRLDNALPRYLKFIGVKNLWDKTKGKGIKIAVIDDGFDLKHKEFEKINMTFAYDVIEKSLESNPKESIDTHGTKVAGVLFAQHDKQGIEGIAPEAEFIAIRQPDTWTSNTLLSFQVANLSKADIINCSWNSPQLMQPVADVINDLAQNGRNGKGTAVIIAAGNKGIDIKPNSTEASIDSAIVVGASNLMGKRPLKFSNKGESVDLLSFGVPVLTTFPNNKYGIFAKTSLATTVVSGVSALILSQNPEFTIKQLEDELKKMTTNNKRINQFKNRSTKKAQKQETNND